MQTLPRFCLLLLLGLLLGKVSANDLAADRAPLTSEQIEELVAPIALYPDPLIALILPASTFPSDIVLAARYLDDGGAVESVTAEPWDDSVRALARYGEVIDYLDTHLAWTRSLGHCFLDQPDAVMDAIQMVRARARTAGLLQDTAEQQVIVESEEIRIVPAQPTVIYVPRYDPEIIWASTPVYYDYHRPFITFGIGWSIGAWLNFDCDWRARAVRIVHRPAYWYHAPQWHDHDRFRHHGGVNWTRRTPHPHHDRFDRSPRAANYVPRGADHRQWSDRNRIDHASRDPRPDQYRHSPNDGPRSRDWNDRRPRETSRVPSVVVAPVVAPLSAPEVVATSPQMRVDQSRRRTEASGQSPIDRQPRPTARDSNHRRHEAASERYNTSHPARSAPPAVTHQPQRVTQPRQETPRPTPRVETAQNRSGERRHSDGQSSRGAERRSNRGVEREPLER